MKEFLAEDFLLESPLAVRLYQDYAQGCPIFDYHCHLPVQEISDDKTYQDISELWLGGDHYKWRAMRSNGVPEEYITGQAEPREKFQKWAETLPRLQGNPLYHWAHLELRRFFDISTLLDGDSAEEVWQECNQQLARPDFSARQLIERSNVWGLCTTDDPCDDLATHQSVQHHFRVGVFPTFRPDRFINLDRPSFLPALSALARATGENIHSYAALLAALGKRLDAFHQCGCRLSDHGLDTLVFTPATFDDATASFRQALAGRPLDNLQLRNYQSHLLSHLGQEYAKRGWVMQLHLYALRNVNSRRFAQLGPDSGFDAISAGSIHDLAAMLDALDRESKLPRTILYSLNPGDTPLLGALMGCFQQQGCPGYIQLGSAWWFNDTLSGMRKQLQDLAELGCLGNFVGMLTDSRSFLSYARHEYFRRILCNLLGEWASAGLAPNDPKSLGPLVADICFANVRRYIPVPWPPPAGYS